MVILVILSALMIQIDISVTWYKRWFFFLADKPNATKPSMKSYWQKYEMTRGWKNKEKTIFLFEFESTLLDNSLGRLQVRSGLELSCPEFKRWQKVWSHPTDFFFNSTFQFEDTFIELSFSLNHSKKVMFVIEVDVGKGLWPGPKCGFKLVENCPQLSQKVLFLLDTKVSSLFEMLNKSTVGYQA